MKYKTAILLMLLVVAGCRTNSANGQVIPGSDGITIERCNEIVSKIPDHNPYEFDPSLFSKEFVGLMNDFQSVAEGGDVLLSSLLGEIGGDEFMYYWHSGNGEGFTGNAQKSYTFLGGSGCQATLLLNMDEAFYDENGSKLYDLHDSFKMLLVKENGKWVLDDWFQDYGGEEMYSRKDELKEYLASERSIDYVCFLGRFSDDGQPASFKAMLAIGDELIGAFRFDSARDDFYYLLNGSLDDGGNIHFKVNADDGSEHVFSGSISSDRKNITGECQVYSLSSGSSGDRRLKSTRSFVMDRTTPEKLKRF